MKALGAYRVAVFSGPDDGARDRTIANLRSFVRNLNRHFGIKATIDVYDGHIDHEAFASSIVEVLRRMVEVRGAVNPEAVRWFFYLAWNRQDRDYLQNVSKRSDSEWSLIGDICEELVSSEVDLAALEAVFLSLRGSTFAPGNAPWGLCYDEYPRGLAMEITGHTQSQYHEFLHLFGVSEGYDEHSCDTLPGCESCWMQYQSTNGSELCARHVAELRDFLASTSPLTSRPKTL